MEENAIIHYEEPTGGAAIIPFEELAERARDFYEKSRSANTMRAYSARWRGFVKWCGARGLESLPAAPGTVGLFLADNAARWRVSTLSQTVAAIVDRHRDSGFDSPMGDRVLSRIWAGIRRERGAPPQGKAPLLLDELRRVVSAIPEGSLIGLRDKALLLCGFMAAMRRSELVGLDVEAVEFREAGMVLRLTRSKTNQTGELEEIAVPLMTNPALCPVRAVRAWIAASGIESGPLFRAVPRGLPVGARLRGSAIPGIVQRRAKLAGIEDPKRFAAHSLRSGFATSAARAGANLAEIMTTTRHRSVNVAMGYVRQAHQFDSLPHYKL